METVQERLKAFIKYKGMNLSEFGRSIGVSAAFVNSMRKSMQPDKVEVIASKYPELNTGWLMTGAGTMLNGETPVAESVAEIAESAVQDEIKINPAVWKVICQQAESLSRKDRQIDDLIAILKKNVAHVGDAGCADANGFQTVV